MEYKVVELESFIIQAMKTRTTNENNLSSKHIGVLWDKFYKENVSNKISNKKSSDIISVYTEYVKDYTGPYTYYLGHKLKKTGQKMKDLFFLMIPKGKYALIEVSEPFPESIINTWTNIWKSNIMRAYKFDFEVYGSEYFKEKEKSMKIYISI